MMEPMAEEPDRAPPGEEDPGTGTRARLERWWKRSRSRAVEAGERLPFSGVAVAVYRRDKHAAGTLLGSALALRLFLFLLPTMLLLLGIAGILGRYSTVDSLQELGIGGALGDEIDTTFDQDRLSPWIAMIVGIVGMATAGWSLSRALVLSSALSWQMGGNQPLRMRVVSVIVGILFGVSFTWMLVNQIRQAAGIAVASASFVGVACVYLVLWSLLYIALPRATNDPGAALPGAAVISVVMTVLRSSHSSTCPRRSAARHRCTARSAPLPPFSAGSSSSGVCWHSRSR